MILEFNKDKRNNPGLISDIEFINKMMKDSIEQSEELEELVEEAPDILDGYENFREILRMEKRGTPHEKAINWCAFFACPPSRSREYRSSCDSNCERCWNEYYKSYSKIVMAEDRNKNNKP